MSESAEKSSRSSRVDSIIIREAILAAAKKSFATEGFSATTIRKVARDAGVDPARVMQLYQSKDILFGASLAVGAEALNCIAHAFNGPVQGLGLRVARAFFTLFDQDSGDAEALRAMLRAALASEAASAHVRDFIQYRLVEVISPKLPAHADAHRLAGLAASLLVGVIIGRNIVKIPVLAFAEREVVIDLVGSSIQHILADRM